MELTPAARKKGRGGEKSAASWSRWYRLSWWATFTLAGFSQGRTMRNSETVDRMRYVGQREEDGVIDYRAEEWPRGCAIHRVSRRAGLV